MQPDMAGWLDAVRQQSVMGAFATSAGEAPAGRRALEVAVQPFDDAAFESQGLRVWARQPAVELCDAGALIEMRLPVLSRPAIIAGSQELDQVRLVAGQQIEDSGGRRRRCFQNQIHAINMQADSCIAGGPQGVRGAHSRALQLVAAVFSGSE